MSNKGPERDARTRAGLSGRGKGAALLVVAIVVIALFWAMQAIVQHNALQNCIDSGRRDCGAPASP